jgi:sporulation protein YlmC with PRC-barrel domain
MDISPKAEVMCTDGACGRTEAVILNPDTEQVTHVVVAAQDLPYSKYLVPVELISESTSDLIRLRCTIADLEKLERFTDTELIPNYFNVYEAGTSLYGPGEIYTPPVFTLEHKHVPKGELEINRGSRVEATDGFVGRVDEFIVEPTQEQISHLVMREGHLWGKKDIVIPAEQIDRIEDNTVYLKLDKKSIEGLPAIPIHKRK